MAVNKVVYDGETIIDLTDSTVSPASLAEGETAYDASGTKVTGTMPTSVVLYNKTQNLTETQKAQARSNIGAVSNNGWGINKNLGTDENGNVIEKEDIFQKDTSAWKPIELIDGVTWTELGYYWDRDGKLVSTQYTSVYQSITELVPIEPNCDYTVSGFSGVITLYNQSKTSGEVVVEHYAPATTTAFTSGSQHYYMGISYKPDGSWTSENASVIRTTMSEAEYNALPTRADTLKALYGKKVVCFGDSLFGMYRGSDSATAFVEQETGANVYNVGFGGCRMSVHPSNGYAAFSMWALAKAIAENNWTTQDAQASSGSSYFPEQLALLKSIDFDDVDIAVIHYGTNDFGAGNVILLDNENDHDDYNTLCGALRYSIEKLLGAYPQLRIFVSLPVYRYWTSDGATTYAESYTNKNGNILPEFVEALRNTASEYNLPVIDGYYGLGINKANASEFLSDGTHHNETGRERFGRYIGQSLIAQQTIGKGGSVGETGFRGFSVLRITTAPSSYTTATGGYTPKYRVALSTVLSQSTATEVVVGDTVLYSYYTYPVGYVDADYVYLGTRTSIRGSTGAAGSTPVKGTDYWTEADKAEIINDVIASLPVYNGELI